jgi:cell division protein FtsQ
VTVVDPPRPPLPPRPRGDGASPRPRIDPRVRERRVQVKREEGRRRLRFLLASLALLVLVGGAVGATRSPLMDVDRVLLRGARRTSLSEVMAATRLDRRPLLVELDTKALARRVERLPWVLHARVERSWPATVSIGVTERTPAAAVAFEKGGWALADGRGRVLALAHERPGDLPAVAGVMAREGPGSNLSAAPPDVLRVAAALPAPLRSRVAEVGTGAGELELRLRFPGIVRLGSAEDLAAKLTSALTVLEKAGGGGFAVIDVRVPETPVLTRR